MGQSVRRLFIYSFIYLFILVCHSFGWTVFQSVTLSFGRSVIQSVVRSVIWSVGQSVCRWSVPFHAVINSVAKERKNEGIVRAPGPAHR